MNAPRLLRRYDSSGDRNERTLVPPYRICASRVAAALLWSRPFHCRYSNTRKWDVKSLMINRSGAHRAQRIDAHVGAVRATDAREVGDRQVCRANVVQRSDAWGHRMQCTALHSRLCHSVSHCAVPRRRVVVFGSLNAFGAAATRGWAMHFTRNALVS